MPADFLDTNIFVYVFDRRDARRSSIAERVVAEALDHGSATISPQVVQETLNVITSRLPDRATAEQARRFMDRVLLPLWRSVPTGDTYHRALDLHTRYQFHLYDALIVAAAIEAGCTRLLSEDFQHGQRIGTLVIEDPFRD